MELSSCSGAALEKFYLVEDSEMPGGDIMVGPLKADSLESCALLCERHNSMLKGSYGANQDNGAGATGYSFDYCNAFVYDRQRGLCTLKNKRMGNFYPQQGLTKAEKDNGNARYVSGYRWNSLMNEVNTSFPNMTSGMQHMKVNPSWSTDNWGVTNNHCTQGTQIPIQLQHTASYCPESVLVGRGVSLKPVGYDVRPGAIISPKNGTTGPYSGLASHVPKFRVSSMQECANLAASQSALSKAGANAWTFHPDYTIGEATSGPLDTNEKHAWTGTCTLGHVREPYYQTLTASDNGAISGFALTSLSREIQRFLFGETQ